MTFGATEILIVIAILVFFFGAKKIPEMARGIGQGIKEFKKVSRETEEDSDQDSNKTADGK